MATLSQAPLTKARQRYRVLAPYQCPNRQHWYQVGDDVELLACEASFLLLAHKISAPISNHVANNISNHTSNKTVASNVDKNTPLASQQQGEK
ncbi:hypothetical protein HQQ94_05435 [Shewanella sp. VB17]|uniref:hypothetical protein n=1 Tax=Shewanella sp. VB17 TaxID=2739432 RepID=UPI00156478EA|nr:hypothetical protein [Shewanella sp. VB17]NRD72699.1 hypothetical protein [Shewanella sp. VB17]